jgi:glycosyltransferase involved in cell wall biosynthesis
VLIQVDNFDQGGLENVVLMMSQGLGVHGFQPLLLVLGRSGPAAARARELGLQVLHIPQREREQHYRTLLQEQSVGLVVAHYSTFGAPVAAARGVPFVQVMHNSYVWFSEDQRAEYRQADPFVSAYVCVSAEVACYSDRVLGLPVRKMVIIPNGIDTQALDHARESGADELRAELGLGESDFVYLNVASLHAGKAQVALFQAMAKVVRARPDSKLILAGESLDPAYRQRVESLIAALDLSRHVSLVGQRADIMRFYWMADALVLPSYWEGWSLALTEAACTGLPFVATDVGGARELLQYSSGLLVKPPFGAITELDASRIGHLVRAENHQFVDDLARQLIAANGHSKRKPVCDALKTLFDQARAVENHANFYRWVMQQGDPAAGRVWSRMPSGPFGADGDLRKPGSVERLRRFRTPGGSLRFDQAETSAPAHTARPADADLGEVPAKSAQADVQ